MNLKKTIILASILSFHFPSQAEEIKAEGPNYIIVGYQADELPTDCDSAYPYSYKKGGLKNAYSGPMADFFRALPKPERGSALTKWGGGAACFLSMGPDRLFDGRGTLTAFYHLYIQYDQPSYGQKTNPKDIILQFDIIKEDGISIGKEVITFDQFTPITIPGTSYTTYRFESTPNHRFIVPTQQVENPSHVQARIYVPQNQGTMTVFFQELELDWRNN